MKVSPKARSNTGMFRRRCPALSAALLIFKKTASLILAAATTFLLSTGTALCSEARQEWNEFGFRLGLQVGPKNENFKQYDVFGVYGLPWEWRTDAGWGLVPKVNVSLGLLDRRAITGLIGSIGSVLAFNKTDMGLEPEVGVNVNILDRRVYEDKNFGSILQLGAFLGIAYRFKSGPVLSYRLQHISNAHIFYSSDNSNPGLDMQFFGVSWSF